MNAQRVVAVVVLVLLAMVSLPVVAAVLDGQGTENWIIPVHLLLMALVGAVVGRVVPALAGEGAGADRRRSMVVGALVGLAAAVLGLVVFFVLLGGLGGA